jgi:hypothetical protein
MQSDDRKGEVDAGGDAVVAKPVSVAGAFLTCNPDAELANQQQYEANKLVVRCALDVAERYEDWQFFYKVDDEKIQVDDAKVLEEGKSSKWALAIRISAIKQGADLMIAAASEKAGISADFEDSSKSNNGFQAVIDYRSIADFDEIRGLLQSAGDKKTESSGDDDDDDLILKKSDVKFKLAFEDEGINFLMQAVSSISDGIFRSEIRPTGSAHAYQLSLYEKGGYRYLRLKITDEGHSYCMHQISEGNIFLFVCNEFNFEEMRFKQDSTEGGFVLNRNDMCLGLDKQLLTQKDKEEKRYDLTTVSCNSDDVLIIGD